MGNPFSKFGTGNQYILEIKPNQEDTDVRQELSEIVLYLFIQLNGYLCESSDDLTSLVVKLLPEVENKNIPLPEFPEHPFQEHLKQL